MKNKKRIMHCACMLFALILMTGFTTIQAQAKVHKVKLAVAKTATKTTVKNLKLNDRIQLKIKYGKAYVAYRKPKYKSSKPSVAGVSRTGRIVPRKPGKAVITVTYKKQTAKIQVVVFRPVTKIKLNKTKWTAIIPGITTQLKATCTPKNATSRTKVLWSSSNTQVARVDAKGYVTSVSKGVAIITAVPKYANSTKVKATCKVVVESNDLTYDQQTQDDGYWDDYLEATKVMPTAITLSKQSLNLTTGQTATLVATISPATATNKDVEWSSNNTSIATVSSAGKITAKAAGTALITAKTKANGLQVMCAVIVTNPTTTPTTSNIVTVGGVKWDISRAMPTTQAGGIFQVQAKSSVNPTDVKFIINGGKIQINGKNTVKNNFTEASVPNAKQLIGEISYGPDGNNIYRIGCAAGAITGSFTAQIQYKGAVVASTKFVVSKASPFHQQLRVWANAIENTTDFKNASGNKNKITQAAIWVTKNLTYNQANCQTGVEIVGQVARDLGYVTAYENVTYYSGTIKKALHLTGLFPETIYHARIYVYDTNGAYVTSIETEGHKQ